MPAAKFKATCLFLLATARSLGARLATCDERLLRYGEAGHVLTLDARA